MVHQTDISDRLFSLKSTRDIVIVAGSIALADGTSANVASYVVSNSTWSPLGSPSAIPGPVTALEVNDANEKSIFAAGRYVILLVHARFTYTELTHTLRHIQIF